MYINDLVKINTDADKENIKTACKYRDGIYWEFDYTYNKLSENLLNVED